MLQKAIFWKVKVTRLEYIHFAKMCQRIQSFLASGSVVFDQSETIAEDGFEKTQVN